MVFDFELSSSKKFEYRVEYRVAITVVGSVTDIIFVGTGGTGGRVKFLLTA